MKIPEWPIPNTIKYLTPSSYETLRDCPLRGYLNNIKEYRKYAVKGPKAIIGSVCHQIIESVNKGHLDNLNDDLFKVEISRLYKEECKKQFLLNKDSMMNYNYNNASDWPGFNIRLSRLKQLACSLFKLRNNANANSNNGVHYIEQKYEALQGKIRGKPDRVLLKSNNQVLIEDYKFGIVYESNLLQPNIRRQMLMYSYICSETFNTNKVTYRVIPGNGVIYQEEVDVKEAYELAIEAVGLLDNVNNMIHKISLKKCSYEELGNPSEDNCRYCPYRFCCDSFWEDNYFIDANNYLLNFMGQLQNISCEDHFIKLIVLSNYPLQTKIFIEKLPKEKFRYLVDVSNKQRIIGLDFKYSIRGDNLIAEPMAKSSIWYKD